MATSVFRYIGGRVLGSSRSACKVASRVSARQNSSYGLMAKSPESMMFPRPTVVSSAVQMHRRNLHLSSQRLEKSAVDSELVQFLTEEIGAETKAQKRTALPGFGEFKVKTDGSNVTLLKTIGSENVTIKMNVNHTVNPAMAEDNVDPSKDQADFEEMSSKPSFTVEVEKGGNVLGFACSFAGYPAEIGGEEAADVVEDSFHIDEVVFHQGEWKESTYSVSGEIIDGYLYDLMMNYLESRGVNAEFSTRLTEFCTSYEHKLYINLLENIKAFISGEAPKIMDQASRKQ